MVRCGTKENPIDLGTKVLEREAMSSCMSKLAIIPANVARREARVHFGRRTAWDVNFEAHGVVADDTAENAKDTADRKYQVGAEEVDAADVSNKDAEGLKKRGEQFLEARKALEMPTGKEKLAKGVGFGNRTCSCGFRVTRKRERRGRCSFGTNHEKRRVREWVSSETR